MARAELRVSIADSPALKAAILAAYEQGWTDGYGQGRDDEAEGLAVRERADIVTEPVHACPEDGSGVTPCCDRTPFELPATDRMTHIPALATCRPTTRTDRTEQQR